MNSSLILINIESDKKKLFSLYDDGEITGLEYAQELNKLFQYERDVYREIDRLEISSHFKHGMGKRNVALALIAIFIVGFFISPFLYPKIFGYKSAEECLLDHTNNFGFSACYDLYPSVKQ